MKDRMVKAEKFDLSKVVDRYQLDHGVPQAIAQEHEKELKRFLVLCAEFPTEGFGMAGAVDELWHTFIVFTKDYAEFCNTVAGHYIHHEPAKKSDGFQKSDIENYQKFLKVYEKSFGEAPPSHIWPQVTVTEEHFAMGCTGVCGVRCIVQPIPN